VDFPKKNESSMVPPKAGKGRSTRLFEKSFAEIPPDLPFPREKHSYIVFDEGLRFPPFFKREAVKKFRPWEVGGPNHFQGREKFAPPK
jgi:hypothetical protein